ncbi:MAG: thioesterase family protein [Propionibacteriaceae bacterium]|jgi:acyl-CoA thioester hydrolase|nr:thioesterase family protein [Propionibacteriaceae bacterium]
MSFHALVQRRWTDLDAQGHANNTAFVEYTQEARTQFLGKGGAAGLLTDGLLVVTNQVEFVSSIPFSPDPLRVEVVVSDIGNDRFTLASQIYDQTALMARARTLCCAYDFDAATPRPLSEGQREYLESHFVSVDGFREMPHKPLGGNGIRYPFYPRWSDLDPYGHVNNVRYFDFIQEARIAAMTSLDTHAVRIGTSTWGDGELPKEFVTWLLARQDVEYFEQLPHRLEPYMVVSAPVKIGSTSITYNAEVVDPADETKILARAVSVVVCADANGVPRALPDTIRQTSERYMVGQHPVG